MIVAVVLVTRLDFNIFSYILLGLISIYLGTFYWLPQSPYHLILKNKLNKAAAALEFYQHDINVDTEIELLKNFIKSNEGLIH